MAGETISFRRITPADHALLSRWLAEPHVRAWWGDPAEEIALIREGEANGESRGHLGCVDGEPIAYLQTWTPSDHDEEAWQRQVPRDTIGIDMLIGPPDRVGRGFGAAVLAAFADRLLAEGAARLLIDPDAANLRAIRAYEKAGFRRFAVAGRDGDTILMERGSAPLEDNI